MCLTQGCMWVKQSRSDRWPEVGTRAGSRVPPSQHRGVWGGPRPGPSLSPLPLCPPPQLQPDQTQMEPQHTITLTCLSVSSRRSTVPFAEAWIPGSPGDIRTLLVMRWEAVEPTQHVDLAKALNVKFCWMWEHGSQVGLACCLLPAGYPWILPGLFWYLA